MQAHMRMGISTVLVTIGFLFACVAQAAPVSEMQAAGDTAPIKFRLHAQVDEPLPLLMDTSAIKPQAKVDAGLVKQIMDVRGQGQGWQGPHILVPGVEIISGF
jgi:hypothetical protein